MAKKGEQAIPGSNANPKTLFEQVQTWTDEHYPPLRGQAMHPSGARIFYVVLLVFLRQHPQAQITPDMSASDSEAQRFLEMMPAIAERLATEYKHAFRLTDRNKNLAVPEMERFLRTHTLASAPRLSWAAEHMVGIADRLSQEWQGIWGKRWREAEPAQQARLWPMILNHLLVTPVARPSAELQQARNLLIKRIEQGRQQSGWTIASPADYLYDIPLEEWLLQPLLSVQWFFRLCQALAELALEVPALIRQRASEVDLKSSNASAQEESDAPSQEAQRPVPPVPQGIATAEAIFTYALSAWRLAAGAAGEDPILRDAQRTFALAEFQALLALAIKATEFLLWDEPSALHTLPPLSAERRRMLRQALLPARLRKQHEDLLTRIQRHERTQAPPSPQWKAWETTLDAALEDLDQRLETSIKPAAITSASLDDLLHQPRAALAGQYLYHASLREWLCETLARCLLDGAALLAYCQHLAEALGTWPPNTPGAPSNAEQAGRAIFWFAKRWLEAKIERSLIWPSPTDAASNHPEPFPQRQDGGLVIWLGSGPLPPEALELATTVALLIARVLHKSSWEAARRGQPLFAAALKEGNLGSIETLLKELELRARSLDLPNPAEAAQEAWEKLQQILYHFAPPADITEAHLAGDRAFLAALDISDKVWYISNTNDYNFIGIISSFAKNIVRYSRDEAQQSVALAVTIPAGPPQTNEKSRDPQEEDCAALEVVSLIVEAAQSVQRSTAGEEQTRGDAWRLVQDIFTNNTGREIINRLAHQGEPVASAMIALWQQQVASAQEGTPIIHLQTPPERLEQNAALARFLISPAVQQSPERRRAVGDLFERPMYPDAFAQSGRMSLGTLERQATWAIRTRWRVETLRALEALEGLAEKQRKMLSAHLLAQEPTALTLKLLEHTGWTRPLWLRIPGPVAETTRADDSRGQLFLVARKNWMKQLSTSATTYHARALAAEWVGYQFWDRPWQDRLHEHPYEPFYRTLLAALPPRLLQVLQAAWVVATPQKLAHLSELLGLTGCLPPQLPAQLDHRTFFEAMLDHLDAGEEHQPSTNSSDSGAALPAELRQLRRELRTIRWRTFAWFQALGGLADDNQQRIVLAAMSACAGKAEQIDQWIEGQVPSQTQVPLLAYEAKRWHHQSSITEQNASTLLQTAAAEVKPVWHQLRRPPHF